MAVIGEEEMMDKETFERLKAKGLVEEVKEKVKKEPETKGSKPIAN